MALEWKPTMSVGVDIIDTQHQELIRRINDLLASMGSDEHANKLESTLKFLEDYIATHFGTEEDYMKRHDYPGYAEHKGEHESFKASLNDLKAELDKSGPSLAITTKTNIFVSGWLLNHISRIDTKLGEFLKPLL
ncbi:MAG: bacteriohemerythrin [Thermodesulfobacteriota bacterium]